MYKKINQPFLIMLTLLTMVLAVSPAYAGSAVTTRQGTPQPTPISSQTSTGVDTQVSNFDCSQVAALGIDKQLNMRASLIRIQCGLDQPGSSQPDAGTPDNLGSIAAYGGTDTQVNNALADTFPQVTQATTSFAVHGQTVVAAYNSSTGAPGNYSGISYSLDGGVTFTEIRPSPFATGHGTNYGDPMAFYSSHANLFYTFWLTTGCGGQGIGWWTSADGVNWNLGSCAHMGTADDRQEAWVDNNPSSPFYGTIYLSWNDYAVNGGALSIAHSTDNGATWSVTIANNNFIRNVQGVVRLNGDIFLTTMDEGGGGTNPRQNKIYISHDEGATFSVTTMGAPFTPPGDISCGYFEAISPIWRYMGWGSLGVTPDGVLIYAYTAGDPGDIGNIYFVKSLDSGATWYLPVRLNTDAGTRAQWMPSVGVTPNGMIVVSWYDRRNTSNDDYQRFARVSLDNGLTWQPDQPLSDQIIPQPAQPDPLVTPCYAGDYNRTAVSSTSVFGGWTDGRVSINGTPQEDVYADRVFFILSVYLPLALK